MAIKKNVKMISKKKPVSNEHEKPIPIKHSIVVIQDKANILISESDLLDSINYPKDAGKECVSVTFMYVDYLTTMEQITGKWFDLLIDMTDWCMGLASAAKMDKYSIGLLCPESQHKKYPKCKLTMLTHVTFVENAIYHLNRYFSGELQKELGLK
jgi:hypothetical protein